MADCTIHFKIYPDPPFPALIEACRGNESIKRRALFLMDKEELIAIAPTKEKLTISWHLTDAALDLLYEAKSV